MSLLIGFFCNKKECDKGKFKPYNQETVEQDIKDLRCEALENGWFINGQYTFCPKHNTYNSKKQ